MRAMEIGIALLGLVCALLVNLLADNLPQRRLMQAPCCRACENPREPDIWLAVVSLLGRKDNCSQCGARRSRRDVLVELSLVIIALWLYGRDPAPGTFWPGLVVATIFTLIVVIDIEHRLILHVVSVPAGILILIMNSLDPSRGFLKSLAGGGAGFVLVFGMYLLGNLFGRYIAKVRKQEGDEVAFGFGDVMLGTMLGLTVGWSAILLALIFAIFAGGIFSLLYMLVMTIRDRYSAFQPIPYGPFLIFGAVLVYFFRESIVRFMAGG